MHKKRFDLEFCILFLNEDLYSKREKFQQTMFFFNQRDENKSVKLIQFKVFFLL